HDDRFRHAARRHAFGARDRGVLPGGRANRCGASRRLIPCCSGRVGADSRENGMDIWKRARPGGKETPGAAWRANPRDAAGRKTDQTRSEPPVNTWLLFLLLLILNLLVFRQFFADPEPALTIPYTVFKEQAEAGNVAEVYNQGQRIEGRFVEPVTYPPAAAADGRRCRG